MGGQTDGRTIALEALYQAPVTVCAQAGSARYRVTLAASDRLVLDLHDGDRPAGAELGELVSIGCPDPAGWVTGEVRIVARHGEHGLVTTAPQLALAQRRASHRVALVLPIDVAEADEADDALWVRGETVDVSADGLAAQVPPVGIVRGDRLLVRLGLPDGHVVEGQADVVLNGPLLRARWEQIAERDRDRIVDTIHLVEVGAGR